MWPPLYGQLFCRLSVSFIRRWVRSASARIFSALLWCCENSCIPTAASMLQLLQPAGTQSYGLLCAPIMRRNLFDNRITRRTNNPDFTGWIPLCQNAESVIHIKREMNECCCICLVMLAPEKNCICLVIVAWRQYQTLCLGITHVCASIFTTHAYCHWEMILIYC